MLSKIEIGTHRGSEMIDITAQVQEQVARSGVKNGLCHVWVPHTTAGITVNENADPAVRRDILAALTGWCPGTVITVIPRETATATSSPRSAATM